MKKCVFIFVSLMLCNSSAVFSQERVKEDVPLLRPTDKPSTQLNDQQKKMAIDNAIAGAQFLQKNAARDNINTLPGGIQYEILQKGSGLSPKNNDTITVKYEGKFINGALFTSPLKEAAPQDFKVSELLPGLNLAVKIMPVNSLYRLYIPSALAYGPKGLHSAGIQPNTTLIYDLNLISIAEGQKPSEQESLADGQPLINASIQPPPPLPLGIGSSTPKTPPFISENKRFNDARVNFNGYALNTIEKAAYSFINFRNNLMPVARDIDIEVVCLSVATNQFSDKCQKYLKDHVQSLKDRKIGSAKFSNIKIENLSNEKNAVRVSWQETFKDFQEKTLLTDRNAKLYYEKKEDGWRISSGDF